MALGPRGLLRQRVLSKTSQKPASSTQPNDQSRRAGFEGEAGLCDSQGTDRHRSLVKLQQNVGGAAAASGPHPAFAKPGSARLVEPDREILALTTSRAGQGPQIRERELAPQSLVQPLGGVGSPGTGTMQLISGTASRSAGSKAYRTVALWAGQLAQAP